jgi:hypothetical protein
MRSTVHVFNVTPKQPVVVRTLFAFNANFTGGIASLDTGFIHGSAVPEIIVGAGQGYGSMVRVFDGVFGNLLTSFRAYQGDSRHSAVQAAVLDTDGDGIVDQIITAQGPGGITREIRTFEALTGELVDELLETDMDFSGEYRLATAS